MYEGIIMVTMEQLYGRIKRLCAKGVQQSKIQIILTKETMESLLGQEIKLMNITGNDKYIDVKDIRFGGFRVYLGIQDKIQVIDREEWL